MKKIIRNISVLLVYLFVVTLLPTGIFTQSAKAEEDIPKHLEYSDIYVGSVVQYKDKALIAYIDGNERGLSLFEKGKETKKIYEKGIYRSYVENSSNNTANLSIYSDEKVEGKNYSFLTNEIKDIDIDTGSFIEDEVEKKDIMDKFNNKYSLSLDSTNDNIYLYKKNGVEIYNFTTGIEDQYKEYAVLNFKNGEMLVDSGVYTIIDKEGDLWFCNNDLIIKTKDGNKVGTYSMIDVAPSGVIDGIFNNTLYVVDYINNKARLVTYKISGDKYVKDKEHELIYYNFCNVDYDLNGDVWALLKDEGGNFVCKYENDKFIKKYEVASFMDELYVYDENNIIVSSAQKGMTFINKGTNTDTSIDTNTNNEAKTEITTADNKTTVNVKNLSSDKKNIINAQDSENNVTVNITDIETLKSGKGSALINLSNDTTINMPFSIIDKSLLEGATNVAVKFNILKDSDILKDIKAVNKVYEFDLEISYGSEVKKIHNFAEGNVEVTLNLTNDDLKNLDKSKLSVMYYNEETKKFEKMDTKINDNLVTFTTGHFSKFVIAEIDNNQVVNKTANTTKTNDINNASSILLFTLGSLVVMTIGMSTIYVKKRRQQ